jgi:hypothetical protein
MASFTGRGGLLAIQRKLLLGAHHCDICPLAAQARAAMEIEPSSWMGRRAISTFRSLFLLSSSGMKFKTSPDTTMFTEQLSNGKDSALPTQQCARLPSR